MCVCVFVFVLVLVFVLCVCGRKRRGGSGGGGGLVGVVIVALTLGLKGANLTADSLRSVPQDILELTSSSVKANDWRTREHVVLDLFSN